MSSKDTNTAPVATPALSPIVVNPAGMTSQHDKHFCTNHLLSDLKGRAVSSGFVTLLSQGVQFVLMLGSTMILARLLTPQDFGLVAMVVTITGFLRIFNDAGLSTATIQREGITHAQVSNLFWTNLALGGSVTLVLAALSPLIAWFYREPRLVGVTLGLCITFLLSSSSVQHLALLKRQMRFKAIAVIQISASVAGVLVGTGMAWQHYGYWSLVGMQLTTPLVTMLLAWSASRWRPQLPRRNTGTRSLLHFGAHLTASSFLWSLASGSDGLLIGRYFGSAPLGLYSRAGALLMRPIQQFMPAIEAVFVPTLARLQSQPDRYRRTILTAYDIIAATSFMAGGLLFSLAHPLTLVVLGHKWEKAYPIFASFTFAAICMPVGSVSTWLLTSQGRGRDFLILSSSTSFLTIVFFLVGMQFGLMGIAISYSAFYLFVILPVGYYVAGRRGPVTAGDLWGRFFAQLPLWFVVCLATTLTRSLVEDAAAWKQLVICAPAGMLAGIAFICVYPPSRRAAQGLIRTLKEYKDKRRA